MNGNVDIALSKLKLYKDVDENTLLALNLGIYNGTLRFYVNELDTKTGKNKYITSIGLPLLYFRMLLELMDKILEEKDEEVSFSLDIYGNKWVDGEKLDDRVLNAKVVISRIRNKQDDIIYVITIVDKDRNNFHFPFKPTPFVEIYKNKEKIDNMTVLSDIWFKSYFKALKDIAGIIPETEGFNKNNKKSNNKKEKLSDGEEIPF